MFRPLDLSRVGLITYVIRFVWRITGAEPCMELHFLESTPIEHLIGDTLIEKILVQLEGMKNPLKNMLGQSYDNGAKKRKEQIQVFKQNPEHKFLWHFMYYPSLSLVLIEAPQPCLDAVEFLSPTQYIPQQSSMSASA
ncbi:hypothetical protein AVEN_79606-1 [Araneus ventricosus]|uniref:Uncharacterized protein n=1 Tax=Araneus ventricosus TaxID=182803 RepID=A0A4Y2P149_ARAVE|nr:hypothetical protein AVEN_46212-1 [Araneus ventricosus]GBN45121.1 hypothetical protein AVEN_201029-1 [Araneus ventricosus]GBN81455.1 hypothetical protein AVEN_79606-1 [Araneus ventricosus]